MDEWGYSELVVHPPPLNVFTLFILPVVFRKGLMKRSGEVFSKFIFWLENLVYLILMLVYEILLVPLIYFKVIINIIKVASFLNMIMLVLLWVLFGIFFLFFGVMKDMFYFMKTLCDYKDEDDQYREKEEEDFRQDEIVIYNEIFEVMRTILDLFKQRNKANRKNRMVMMRRKLRLERKRMAAAGD